MNGTIALSAAFKHITQALAIGLTVSQIYTRPPEQFKEKFDPETDRETVTTLMHDGCKYFAEQLKIDLTKPESDGAVNMLITALIATKVNGAKGSSNLTTNDPGEVGEVAEAHPAPVPASAPPESDPGAAPQCSTDGTGDSKSYMNPAGSAANPAVTNSATMKFVQELDRETLFSVYLKYCKGEAVNNDSINVADVIRFYNEALKNLPDVGPAAKPLPESSTILDGFGERFTEMYELAGGRRHWIALKDLPPYVVNAFIAAEDQNFYKHDGIDTSGIVRAFASGLIGSGKQQGASTITQQVVKNTLVGPQVTTDRKIREMVDAVRLERYLTPKDVADKGEAKKIAKDKILEIYLNQIFLGRDCWGIEMCSRSYYGKSAKFLEPAEAAMLAGLAKGPLYYSPDRINECTRTASRALGRRKYVLDRMLEDGFLNVSEYQTALSFPIKPKDYEAPIKRGASYFLDELQHQVQLQAGIPSITSGSYVIRTTMNPEMQEIAVDTLQDKLAEWEESVRGLPEYQRIEENTIAKAMSTPGSIWQDVLPVVHSKLKDVHWPVAVVLNPPGSRKRGGGATVGLADGRVVPLVIQSNLKWSPSQFRKWDLVHVRIDQAGGVTTAKLMVPPKIQGAVVVLEAKTGRVLALTGGFSYSANEFNRATDKLRPAGSTMKPFLYMAGLSMGYQPNTLLPNVDPKYIYLSGRRQKIWSVGNYDGRTGGMMTAREGLEGSINQVAVQFMLKMDETPDAGFKRFEETALDFGALLKPTQNKSAVLGTEGARLVDMAAAYGAIANSVLPFDPDHPVRIKPTVHFFDTIEQNGKLVWSRNLNDLQDLKTVNRVAVYQMRQILEGTVARGTAVSLKDKGFEGYVAGKTGTTSSFRDAWFIAFTNDIVVATWVGYDNWHMQKPIVKSHFSGAKVAIPIGAEIISKSFSVDGYPKRKLQGPPPELNKWVRDFPVNIRKGTIMEALRIDASGNPVDTERIIIDNKLNAYEQQCASDPSYCYGGGGDQQYVGYGNYDEDSNRDDYGRYYQDYRHYRPGGGDPDGGSFNPFQGNGGFFDGLFGGRGW